MGFSIKVPAGSLPESVEARLLNEKADKFDFYVDHKTNIIYGRADSLLWLSEFDYKKLKQETTIFDVEKPKETRNRSYFDLRYLKSGLEYAGFKGAEIFYKDLLCFFDLYKY